jgi:hypothetical protein
MSRISRIPFVKDQADLYTTLQADGEIRTPGQRFTKPLLYH